MRWEVAAVALGVLFATALGAASPSAQQNPFTPHAPITITSDAGFTAANGVIAGAGTPTNPFVIGGWSISASSSTAITISNVTKSFVISNDSIAAKVGIDVGAMGTTVGTIRDDQFLTMGTAISVHNADAIIVDNSFGGDIRLGGTNTGISLLNSNSRVEGNAFVYTPYGIIAQGGSPVIRCNDIHDDTVLAGISVQFTTNATIECNTLTSCANGIVSVNAIGTVIADNSVVQCQLGIVVTLTKDAVIVNNTVRASFQTQVKLWHVSGTFSDNLVVDGHVDGVILVQSPMLVENNNISVNLGVGLWLQATAADVDANVVTHNSVGIWLDAGSVSHLTANVLVDNTIGLNIPYESRQAILYLQGNLVNGVNVDGTIDSTQQVYFYQAANVVISGEVRDSGFSLGYYGSLTAQGNVVLYEVDNALIEASVLAHANVGVTATNAFNVVLQGDVITDTIVGVNASTVVTGYQVPPCAVSVKNTTINVTVDPIGTIGVSARACLVNVFDSSIAVVDTGIQLDASSSGTISRDIITQTRVGIDLGGASVRSIDNVTITDSDIGARLAAVTTIVADGTFSGDGTGIQLSSGASVDLRRNTIADNGDGVLDLGVCNGAISPCGSVTAQDNVFASNARNGISVNGTSTFRGDIFADNGRNGARLATATLVGVTASGNRDDGVSLSGSFSIHASTFTGNEGNGATVVGSGDLRGSNFTSNQNAGLFVSAGYVDALDCNFSANLDGILFADAIQAGPLPALSTSVLLRDLPSVMGPDPMDVHRSIFLHNERDAIRAGILLVNATSDYWGGDHPAIDIDDTVGAFQNGVSPLVRFIPWYLDQDMTVVAPAPGL